MGVRGELFSIVVSDCFDLVSERQEHACAGLHDRVRVLVRQFGELGVFGGSLDVRHDNAFVIGADNRVPDTPFAILAGMLLLLIFLGIFRTGRIGRKITSHICSEPTKTSGASHWPTKFTMRERSCATFAKKRSAKKSGTEFSQPKERTLWYYRSLADKFCTLLPGQLSEELREIVDVLERAT